MKHPKEISISTAESITGGRLQAFFTSESGSSDYFMGGICAYSLESKVQMLGVNRDLASESNCVHPEIAKQMALGAREVFGTDMSIATTGYEASFSHKGAQIDAIAYIAVSLNEEVHICEVIPTGDTRTDRLEYVAKEALEFARSLY